MTEYLIQFVMELRLTGDMVVEADSIGQARAVAQQMLDHNVFDMDFTIYEGEVQSEDIFWDQEAFEVSVREVRAVSDHDDDARGTMPSAPHQANCTHASKRSGRHRGKADPGIGEGEVL